MNEIERTHFRVLILDKLSSLEEENRLGLEGQSVVTLDQQAVGRLSRMDALQSQAMAKAQQTRRDLQLKGLHKALQRLADGDFGYCDDCGEDIARKRLDFDPSVTRCINCARG
ncbi:TraR/DksA C4-type zinc finger protein [Shimia thalassica]|uniref:TraR/DksA family transcriptional regulator n=1 Tax=Shimia thalassica TaxID=1715693 RepID=UPI0026E2CDBC|nr:TraR/DksA C4-type zinc finger protein [Shimia thalassica]MDO6522234.1 TraR/DksA C4-type zinc finger protein [Shimia thalassica]MDO6799156.1 TraR/DksA C4-type zinc finger protein [Shimia thalassica]